MPYCESLKKDLAAQQYDGEPIRVRIDDRDIRGGDKKWQWIKKGVPLLVEVGPRDIADNKVTAKISTVAGTKVIKIAGRPIFLRSPSSMVKPARTRMTIRAIFRMSAEMANNSGAIRSMPKGPKRIPVKIKPNKPGSCNRIKSELNRKPIMRIRAIL